LEVVCKNKSTINVTISKGGSFKGTIINHNEKKNTKSQVTGDFKKGMIIKDSLGNKEEINFEKTTRPRIDVDDLEDQKDNESRKVWMNLTREIIKGDFEEADVQKKIIEEFQRNKRKEDKSNISWTPKYFQKDDFGWSFMTNEFDNIFNLN
jgi:hypothetical protein